jgi:hypothetical protein
MARYVEISSNGKQIIGRLYVVEHRAHRNLIDMADDTAHEATVWLRLYTPKWTGYTLRHIDQTKAHWTPGGAGGGGSWTSIAGIKRGESFHPMYAAMGTGIYVGRGLIVPRSFGSRPNTIQEFEQTRRNIGRNSNARYDRLHYRTRFGAARTALYVRGQNPKPFLYLAYQSTLAYARGRVATFGRDLF